METILSQVEEALDHKLYYLAVVQCLMLPEICGALESHDGWGTRARHIQWSELWFLSRTPYDQLLTGEDLYRLRCGVVHQGRFGPSGMRYERVLFTLTSSLMLHGNFIGGVGMDSGLSLQLDAAQFCRDMVSAVKRWFVVKQDDMNVQRNLPHLLQLRPDGLPQIKPAHSVIH